MRMRKRVNFTDLWKLALTICLATVGEIIVINITALPIAYQWLYLVTGIFLLLFSLGLVQLVWMGISYFVDKIIPTKTKLIESNKASQIPRLFVPIKGLEYKKLFRIIEMMIDNRSKVLKEAGLQIKKERNSKGLYLYQYYYNGRLLCYFSMWPRTDEGPNYVAFAHEWNKPFINTNKMHARGEIYTTLDNPKPQVSLSNISLLKNIQPGSRIDISYEDLADQIWLSLKDTIEQMLNRRNG
jgi:hypothetical protein